MQFTICFGIEVKNRLQLLGTSARYTKQIDFCN